MAVSAELARREGDNVNHPAHYAPRVGGPDIECIEAIEAQLTPEEFRGFCKGSVAKYVWRERNKAGNESLLKCVPYIHWAVTPPSMQKKEKALGGS